MTAHMPARRVVAALGLVALFTSATFAQNKVEYRVLSTTKTSTMQKEMLEAADAGYRFADVMGDSTAIGCVARRSDRRARHRRCIAEAGGQVMQSYGVKGSSRR